MSNQSLFLIMSVIFVIASNMDYEDAERLREANRPAVAQSDTASAHLADRHPA
ncbi:MAG: hypothetical protein RLZZ627_1526 [Pseudomonadota bacterium]|jgi:hypothetical protein